MEPIFWLWYHRRCLRWKFNRGCCSQSCAPPVPRRQQAAVSCWSRVSCCLLRRLSGSRPINCSRMSQKNVYIRKWNTCIGVEVVLTRSSLWRVATVALLCRICWLYRCTVTYDSNICSGECHFVVFPNEFPFRICSSAEIRFPRRPGVAGKRLEDTTSFQIFWLNTVVLCNLITFILSFLVNFWSSTSATKLYYLPFNAVVAQPYVAHCSTAVFVDL